MDPTVAAAWITVGGVTVTAVAGFVSTQLSANRGATQSAINVERTLQADHERRLWDEKAALYIALLADVAHRRAARANAVSRLVLAESAQRVVDQELASFESMSRFEFDARARMFASKTVETKLRVAADANTEVLKAEAVRRNATAVGSPDEKVRASAEFTAALELANAVDQQLADTIREEIQRLPAAAPQAVQPARARLPWRRSR